MFSESFSIEQTLHEQSAAQRGAIQGIAAEVLRAAGIHTAEDPRTPFDILASMPDIDEHGDARARMVAVIVGLGDIAV